MVEITRIKEVADVLAGIDHSLTSKWLGNELILKNLATSYDYWLEDTGIPFTLKDFVIQYLDHAQYLGGIFSLEGEMDDFGG